MEQPAENQSTPPKLPLWKKGWFKNLMTVVIFVLVYLSIRPFMQGEVVEGSVPALQMQTITGETIDLKSIDRPTLIHIWATWCPICGVTKGGIESISDDYPVINIATQSGDDEQLLSYAKQNDMKPQIIVNDLDGQILKHFGAKAVPADFIVDSNGEIQFVEVGFTTELGLRLRLWWAGL
ncbi:protein disulfide oxidoreductase [Thiomicrorhabdus sp. ZW0627]|uniref:protein disulfide oxidoreductase n=1 Tax=Thiomicrorhabdus sp. ZW0627 TaxID=3039774 RepID=UPI0024369363|nr:protein disulfide oxidoreductase [Thiomicrorhabdus sp. ZW0627]MDG6773711.1 protein disulfide oxidoreductase [Thiomicrorhabdus sp. ZW0627]